MNDTLQNLMREATRLTQSGSLIKATAAIQRALGHAGAAPMPAAPMPPARAFSTPSTIILDGCVFEVAQSEAVQPGAGQPEAVQPDSMRHQAEAPGGPVPETSFRCANSHTSTAAGAFTEGSHTHASLTRRYKLYTPPGSAGSADSTGSTDKGLPLVVMLHGCTQNPDDFAAGTGMNALAREQGLYVLYPAQSADANPQRCWNWFKHNHQSRGRGEAALLASMTLSIIEQHGIDPRRVYIAGLSAGGAMAAIVAAAYPEIYAAVGVHSGLAVGAASNVSEALAAMGSGAKGSRGGGGGGFKGNGQDGPCRPVPTIVFHGDQDRTVHPRNGEQVREQVIAAVQGASWKHVAQGVSKKGRRFTRTVYLQNDASQRDGAMGNAAARDINGGTHSGINSGSVAAEHWLLHGGGHAWSGGDAKGSYTDPTGPDASGEMLRFFSTHALPKQLP